VEEIRVLAGIKELVGSNLECEIGELARVEGMQPQKTLAELSLGKGSAKMA
jgi:hypothetical protein